MHATGALSTIVTCAMLECKLSSSILPKQFMLGVCHSLSFIFRALSLSLSKKQKVKQDQGLTFSY